MVFNIDESGEGEVQTIPSIGDSVSYPDGDGVVDSIAIDPYKGHTITTGTVKLDDGSGWRAIFSITQQH